MDVSRISDQVCTCPHLGVENDSYTAFAFPSTGNYCYHCKIPASPVEAYQAKYCMSGNFTNCRVFKADENATFPKQLSSRALNRNLRMKGKKKFLGLLGILIFGYLLVLLLPGFIPPVTGDTYNVNRGYTKNGDALAESQIIIPVTGAEETISVTDNLDNLALNMQTAASADEDFSKTQNAILVGDRYIFQTAEAGYLSSVGISTPENVEADKNHREITATILETRTETNATRFTIGSPITVAEYTFYIYEVKSGDSYDSLAAKFNTTVEVLLFINYEATTPLWAKSFIVISPGMKHIEVDLPALKPYQISESNPSFVSISSRTNIDIGLLRQYNQCDGDCILKQGDWILLPYKR